jgi:RNA polymerase sigma factor (sigma-70 family)
MLRPVAWPFRRSSSHEPLLRRSFDDPAAFHDFYRAYVDRVVVFFARRVFDAEVALDLTGETFAIALEERRKFRGRTAAEEQGWLFAIARSQLLRFWKRGAVERAALERLGCEPPESTTADLEYVEHVAHLGVLRESLQAALEVLPRDQAYVVMARVVHGRSYADLAAELGVSEQVVRARLSRGLRTMAKSLDVDLVFEDSP